MAGGVPWTSNCNVVNIGKNYKFKYYANFTILEIIGEGLIKIRAVKHEIYSFTEVSGPYFCDFLPE